MSWQAIFADAKVDFDDLPPSAFEDIARREDDASWWTVYTFPGGSPSRLHAVLTACAEYAGVEPPAAPATMRDAKALLEFIERTPDLEDASYVDGNPPTPDAQETDSSIGLSGDSDGLPNKHVKSR